MNFYKKVTKSNYIREFVTVLNGLFDMPPREKDVLGALIKLDLSWTARVPNEKKNLLSTDNRRLLKAEVNMDKSNFQRIINKLQSIGLLITSPDGTCVVNDLLKPVIIKDKVEITFILDLSDGSVQQTI
jgi:hypothetical protein